MCEAKDETLAVTVLDGVPDGDADAVPEGVADADGDPDSVGVPEVVGVAP